jgi:hypothetical protein
MRQSTLLIATAAAAILAAGCHAAPPRPAAGAGTLWGSLRILGRAPHQGAGSYGDRRLRDARLVDPDRPGFAVVYLEDRPAAAGVAAVEIRSGRSGIGFTPESVAIGAGGTIAIRNGTDEERLISAPELGELRTLAPGESWELAAERVGELRLFLIEDAAAMARIFVAPGAFTVPSPGGEWELRDIAPGEARLGVWHPRSPPISRRVHVQDGEALRLDLECALEAPDAGGGRRAE